MEQVKKTRASKPTERQKRAFTKTLENIGAVKPLTQTQVLLDAGYPLSVALHSPQQVIESKGFRQLMEEAMPEGELLSKHKELLNATRLDHMVFPLEKPDLTDAHIVELLKDVNCTVRKIVHGETSRHVYFWAMDNKARKDALEMAYKIKGKFVPEVGTGPVTNYNFFYAPQIRELSSKYEDDLEKAIATTQHV